MAKKFTIDEFKLTFKKPPTPKGATGKKKDDLETIAKGRKGQVDTSAFEDSSRDLYNADKAYYLELLGYKLAKHWDDGTRKIWLDRSPKEAVNALLDQVLGKNMDDAALAQALEDYDSNHLVKQYLATHYPAQAEKLLTARVKATDDPAKRSTEMRNTPMPIQESWLAKGQANRDPELVRMGAMAYFMKSKDEQRRIAAEDPMFFVDNLMQDFKRDPNAVDIFKDKAMMDAIRTDAAAWKKLVASTPVLSLGAAAKKRVGKQDPSNAEMSGAVFEALVRNEGIDLTYFTNTLDQDRALLTGMNENDRKSRTEMLEKLGTDAPDKPATQCHNLKGVFKQALLANVGTGMRIEEGQIVNMLLTKPIAGMPGGLLPNSFGGNVRNDAGQLTGQVMFTGTGGFQSHTWLIVDGVPFDPVLGTKGAAVAGSVDETFDWKVPEIFGKGSKGNYIVKDPSVKPAPNTNGFGSCYRLTRQPQLYVGGVFGLTFKTDVDEVKVDQVVAGGPADGALQTSDVVLKVDGAPADATRLNDYGRADAGVKREFLVRRAGKKKKLKLVAASPLSFG